MRNIARFLAVTVATALLSACGQIMDQAAEMAIQHDPALVIRPGYKVDIDGKPTEIVGEDVCPRNSGKALPEFFYIGGIPLDGERDCIILAKDRSEVVVHFADTANRKQITEHWTIVRWIDDRGGHKFPVTGLRRPSGAVIQASNS